MTVNFTVTYTHHKTFSVELPKKYEQFLEYENGENNPPTFFDTDLMTREQYWDFTEFVEKESIKAFGEKCDFIASIPMYGKVNSLNVSTAASVILCHAARMQHTK